jgi:hypothetical protein
MVSQRSRVVAQGRSRTAYRGTNERGVNACAIELLAAAYGGVVLAGPLALALLGFDQPDHLGLIGAVDLPDTATVKSLSGTPVSISFSASSISADCEFSHRRGPHVAVLAFAVVVGFQQPIVRR